MDSIEQLTGSNKIFSVILNNAFDAIVCYKTIRDENGEIKDFRFLYMNDSALNTLYGKKEDFIGKNFLSLFPYASQDGMFNLFKRTAETGEPAEEIFYYEDGDYNGWYRDSVVKHGDGIIVYFRDVTPQKKLELELVKKNEELRKALKDKEILLQETHHRVKNNLQIVASLLNLQGNNIEDPKYFASCETCKRRINTMAMVHQRLYEDKDFSAVNIRVFISELINSLRNIYGSNKRIEFICNVDDIEIKLNSSVNLGLLLSELLTNSIKYAFKDLSCGEIKVSLTKNTGVHLNISDNGVGLPENFNIEKIHTLGLTLVKTLVDQMDGSMQISKSPGTSFSIFFPEI